MKYFRMSFIVTAICLLVALLKGGPAAIFTAIVLGILEVSLSFDNAVVNAKVLETMEPKWQHRFLTWGMAIAVFGMRAVFPIMIVAAVASLNPLAVVDMALTNANEYSRHLHDAHVSISAFGAAFLGMVFLKWAMDPEKDVHWLAPIERKLAAVGKLDAVQAVLMGIGLVTVTHFLPGAHQLEFLVAGVVGLVSYMALDGLTGTMEGGEDIANGVKKAGFASFMYLEVLDASFSFDGVIGAFAISKDVIVITAGLAIGAMFVRSLTIMLVEKGTLAEYRYLEHGAHWGIGALAAIMLAGVFAPVPEVITGVLSIAFIGTAVISSIKHNIDEKRLAAQAGAV